MVTSQTYSMSYSTRTRDRYRLTVAAITGALSLGTLTVTGLVAGQAAADHEGELAAKAAEQRAAQARYEQEKAAYDAAVAAAAKPQVIWKKRPVKQRVTVRYIQAGSGSSLGSGGSVGSGSSGGSGGSGGGHSGGSGGGSSSGGGSTPPPPPPPPPTSGS